MLALVHSFLLFTGRHGCIRSSICMTVFCMSCQSPIRCENLVTAGQHEQQNLNTVDNKIELPCYMFSFTNIV